MGGIRINPEEQKKPKIILKICEEDFNTLRDKEEVVLRGREKIITSEEGKQIRLCSGSVIVIRYDFSPYDYICEVLYACQSRKEIKVRKLFI